MLRVIAILAAAAALAAAPAKPQHACHETDAGPDLACPGLYVHPITHADACINRVDGTLWCTDAGP